MKPAVSGVAKVGLPSNKCCNSWLAWVPRKLTHARTWYRIVHVKTAFSSRPINRQGYILLVTRLLDQHLAKDRSATTPKPLGIAHARSAPIHVTQSSQSISLPGQPDLQQTFENPSYDWSCQQHTCQGLLPQARPKIQNQFQPMQNPPASPDETLVNLAGTCYPSEAI